jgi:hypothetical protein
VRYRGFLKADFLLNKVKYMEITLSLVNGQKIVNSFSSDKELKEIHSRIYEGKAFIFGSSIYQGWDIVDAQVQYKEFKK